MVSWFWQGLLGLQAGYELINPFRYGLNASLPPANLGLINAKTLSRFRLGFPKLLSHYLKFRRVHVQIPEYNQQQLRSIHRRGPMVRTQPRFDGLIR